MRSTLKRMADDEQLWRDTDGRYICSPPQLCNAETDATPATGATPATDGTDATPATAESCVEGDCCSVAALQVLHAPDAVAPTTPDEPVLGKSVAAAPKAPTVAVKDGWILRALNGLGGSASSRAVADYRKVDSSKVGEITAYMEIMCDCGLLLRRHTSAGTRYERATVISRPKQPVESDCTPPYVM